MALTLGSVTINPDGTDSGSGMAYRIFAGMRDVMGPAIFVDPSHPPPGATTASMTAILVSQKQALANQATGIATGIVAALLNDAVVNVTIDTGPSFNGLQRLPASFTAGADCLAPTSPKPITGTLT